MESGEEKAKRCRPWRFSVKALFFVVTLTGAFLAGYLSGWNASEWRMAEDELILRHHMSELMRKVNFKASPEQIREWKRERDAKHPASKYGPVINPIDPTRL